MSLMEIIHLIRVFVLDILFFGDYMCIFMK